LFYGDDEYAIAQSVVEFESNLGDSAMAAMNTTRLDGRSYNPEELQNAISAMPFLAERRLVILTNPTARLNNPPAQEKFKELLMKVPPSTALALVENKVLTDERDRKRDKIHWLEIFAEENGDRVLKKEHMLPKGPAFARWIQEQAKRAGGQFTPQAADLLSSLVGGESLLAGQEIQKLLAYVNYRRAVEVEDVDQLTADVAQGDIFVLVDALGNQDGRKAMGMLQRLLDQQEPLSIFSMVVRQFRLLLLARDVLDRGGLKGEVTRELKVSPWLADRLIGQARRFTLADLEKAYHRLLEVDKEMKTSQTPNDLALETMVVAFTASPTLSPRSR